MHTPEQEQIIEEYKKSVDSDVRGFIQSVIDGSGEEGYITVAFYSSNASKRIEELTGKHVDGSRVVLDVGAVKHIINRHGENGKQDSSMKDIDDIARIGYVISNYDEISYDGVTTTGYLDEKGEPSPMIKISKRIDGTYYVIEAVNSSKRKRNYVVTAYMSKK